MNKSHIVSAIVSAILSFFTISTAYAWPNDNSPPPPANVKVSTPIGIGVSPTTTSGAGASSDAKGGAGGAGGGGGNSSLTNSGNGGGATVDTNAGGAKVSTTSNTSDSILDYSPVQVAPLPMTIAAGNIQLVKSGECGAIAIVEPDKNRSLPVPQFFGLISTKMHIPTMQGVLKGFQTGNKAYISSEFELPEPFYKKYALAIGSQLYVTVEEIMQGGGSSSAGDYAAQKMVGGGLSQSANGSRGSVLVVAVPCTLEKEVASTKKPQPETPPVTVNPAPVDPAEPTPEQLKAKIADLEGKLDQAIHHSK